MLNPPIAAGEVVTKVGNTVTAIANLFTEVQKTKQVVATSNAEIVKAVEQTAQVRIHGDVRIKEITTLDRQDERRHTEVMARLQLEAQALAGEQERRRAYVGKTIDQAEERLPCLPDESA